MFTGLVKELGQISGLTKNGSGMSLKVKCEKISKEVSIDDSVSINGVCQTITWFDTYGFQVQVVHGTLEKTTLSELKLGSKVNLELALRLSDRLGGHLVQGHVNGVGKILDFKNYGNNWVLRFSIPETLMRYVVKEGSITLNGVSLTVYDIDLKRCEAVVSIIPHTWDNTIFKGTKNGDKINIEVDILAKYVENLLFAGGKRALSVEKPEKSKISEDWLSEKGFW